MSDKVDRLSPAHLAEWNARYKNARSRYAEGSMSRLDAEEALRDLGFKQDALRIESLVWAKFRDDYNKKKGKF